MATTKRIVCLANSRKPFGRCVAGVELTDFGFGNWIRPVSSREHQEVSEYERQYENGKDPVLLDIIDVPLLKRCPNGYQRENWLLDPELYWGKADTFDWEELDSISETKGILWKNGSSTFHGENDRIPEIEAGRETSSLTLVRVDRANLRVYAPGAAFGNSKRRVQACFNFAGYSYALRVTDPKIEKEFLGQADGEYQLGESFLSISLSEPFEGYSYKLVAAVLQRP